MGKKKKAGRPKGSLRNPGVPLNVVVKPETADTVRQTAATNHWTIRTALEILVERGAKA